MIDSDELLQRAVEAYVYAYPLVIMDATRSTSLQVPTTRANAFAHRRAFPDAGFTDVVRANVDTLYSEVWFDVSQRPLRLRVPDTGDRYYVLPIMDMWTDVFASIGPRTTGSEAGEYLLVAPGWSGTPPAGVVLVRSPTAWGWIIGRTQTNGASDYPAVHAVQDGFAAEPVDIGTTPDRAPVPERMPTSRPPVVEVAEMAGADFFERFSALLAANPPHIADQPQLARLEVLGLTADGSFVFDEAPAQVRNALDQATSAGLSVVTDPDPRRARLMNGWRVRPGTGNYGVDYVTRAHVAYAGLGALPVQEAMYPHTATDQNAEPLSGDRRYLLHFEPDALPPAAAFWSLTMYGADQYLVDNPIGRYAIGDRDPLSYNDDGSLDILIQHSAPADDVNWLPAPADGFSMNLRLYLPRARTQALDWAPPGVQRVD